MDTIEFNTIEDTVDTTDTTDSEASTDQELTIKKYKLKKYNNNTEDEEESKKLLLDLIETLDNYSNAKKELTKVYQKYISLFKPFRKNIFNMDLLLEELDDPGFEFQTNIKSIIAYFDKINNLDKIKWEEDNFDFLNELEISFKIFLSLKNNVALINKFVLYITLKEKDNIKLKYMFENLIDQYINFIHDNTIEFCREEKIINNDIYITVILLFFKIFKKILRLEYVHDYLTNTFKDFDDCTKDLCRLTSVTEHIKKYLYKL